MLTTQVRFGLSVGSDHQDARLSEEARHVPQQPERVAIRPVKVVEDEDQRARRGQAAEKLGDRVEEADSLLA